MKHVTIILALLMMISTNSIQAEIYIGKISGYSNLNYDIEATIWEEIGDDAELSQINGALQALGSGLDISTNTTSKYSKFFIGYNFSRHLSIEAFYLNNLKYSATAQTGFSGGNQINSGDSSFSFNGNISARATGIINLQGVGLRINGMLPITNNLDFMTGVGLLQFKTQNITRVNINGSYSYTGALITDIHPAINELVNVTTGGSNTYQTTDINVNNISFISPVLSVGLLYKLTNNFDIRSEFEIYGLPINGMSITILSIGGQYRFK